MSCRQETDKKWATAAENMEHTAQPVSNRFYYPGDKHRFVANTKGIRFHSGNTDTK